MSLYTELLKLGWYARQLLLPQTSAPATPSAGVVHYTNANGAPSVKNSQGNVAPVGFIASDTLANIVANYPAANFTGYSAFATDMGLRGSPVFSNGTTWRRLPGINDYINLQKYLIIGASGATYSQAGTTVTVTWTAHGLTAAEINGASVYLVVGTGALTTGWYTNFVYVDANTFTVTSAVSQITAGNLGTNTAETTIPANYTIPSTAGYLATGDVVAASGVMRNKNSANNKTGRMYFGGVVVATVTMTSSANWSSVNTPTMINMDGGVFISSGGAQFNPASNLCAMTVQLANSADWACAIFYRVAVTPGN